MMKLKIDDASSWRVVGIVLDGIDLVSIYRKQFITLVKENNNDFTRFEFDYNSFKRSFTIPESVEINKIEASYLNGILNIILPKKKEAQPVPKKLIKIT